MKFLRGIKISIYEPQYLIVSTGYMQMLNYLKTSLKNQVSKKKHRNVVECYLEIKIAENRIKQILVTFT